MKQLQILTPAQMEAIDLRQRKQQAEWKAIPPKGKVEMFCGLELIVLPGVFPPNESTICLADHLSIMPGVTVLDVGTGTGALAVLAAKRGASSIVAVDFAQVALRNAKQNVARLGLEDRVDVRSSRVFSSIAPTDRFDVIVANLPGRNKTAVDETSAAQWDTDYQTHRALFEEAGLHLQPGGKIYMVQANYPDILELISLAKSCCFQVAIIGESIPPRGDFRKYYVLELSKPDQSKV